MFWQAAFMCAAVAASLGEAAAAADKGATYLVGVAKVDITPEYPVRLNGFGFRRTESEGVTQRLFAKALAIGADADGPAVLITMDNLGVPDVLVEEVLARLEGTGVDRAHLAVTFTHTHTAPMVRGASPTIFSTPIPAEHQAHIDRYTRDLTEMLVQVAREALADRRPAKLAWANGRVTFAANRRTKGGPVDHDLPVLVVSDLDGKPRAVYVSYACHCVTLSHNMLSGDWAGYAAAAIEAQVPGTVGLVAIGCGADANPNSGVTGDKVQLAQAQGEEIGREVRRLMDGALQPLAGKLEAHFKHIDLPLAPLPTREQWEERAKQDGPVGYHARVQLERLDRGEALRTAVHYPVQAWNFGDELAMVFLGGEVTVDYSLRLKRELDRRRLWVHGYSNYFCCYIPSERVLKEGGYEGGDAMVYFDLPNRFAPGLERPIVDAVRELVPRAFESPPAEQTQGSLPLSPRQALAAFRPRDELVVDLVAAEPLVASPVAIDFGPDGRLWVAEMYDYPSGLADRAGPGGRIKVLRDTDGDGRYDEATVFLDGIPFPTGVTVWREGVLVCAAPDIIFAADRDGDGIADERRVLFSGFGDQNFQARVNSLSVGLDGWVYGSCGLFGGSIRNARGDIVELGDRDFRIKPDEGLIEPATGRTQQGRVRDDWDNWFGCDNGTLARHYVLAEHYLRRNPFFAAPATESYVPDYPDSSRLYPISRQVLFKLSGPPGLPTANCGLGVYRDELLGEGYSGNLFTCEPVNNLVHRLVLSPKGSTFSGQRAAGEERREFLASTDPWFRPVQARTGPDGALWIVDMYRYIIEHPMWIPPDVMATLDARAGADRGRIWRVYPRERRPRPIARLDQKNAAELAATLDSANGIERDLAGQMLVWSKATAVGPELRRMAREGRLPQGRLQALCVADQLGVLSVAEIERALADDDARVRRHGVRLAESRLAKSAMLLTAVVALAGNPDPLVRLQVAYALGMARGEAAAAALADLLRAGDDDYLRSAAMSSLSAENVPFVHAQFARGESRGGDHELSAALLGQVASLGTQAAVSRAVRSLDRPSGSGRAAVAQRLAALATVLTALERRDDADRLLDDAAAATVERLLKHARMLAASDEADPSERVGAIAVLGIRAHDAERDRGALFSLLGPQQPAAVQMAAIAALVRVDDEGVGRRLLYAWPSLSPQVRPAALDTLFARDTWLGQLLAALDEGRVATSDIGAAHRQRLLEHPDDAVREAAGKLWSAAAGSDRQQIIDQYAAALDLAGDATRGAAAFGQRCANCHKLQGQGHSVGPDIAIYAGKPPQALLIAVLDPNQAVDPRYRSYSAVTNDGRILTGILSAETASSITLSGEQGKSQTVLRSDLDELQTSGRSLMPEGFERDLTPQDLADVIAFVRQGGVPPKQFPGNHPQEVSPGPDGRLVLPATAAEIYGDQIALEDRYQNIGLWHGPDDYVAWSTNVPAGGQYEVLADWACHDGVAGNRFVLEGADPVIRGEVPGTGTWDDYRYERLGTVTLAPGLHRLVFRPEPPLVRPALVDLRGLLLLPLGQALAEPTVAAAEPTDTPQQPGQIAAQILDAARPQAEREALVAKHPALAAELIAAMTADLEPGTPEEYVRIPWIWRVAVAAGRRNDAAQLSTVLKVALPQADAPLRDWQAVVLGGGVINGISQSGPWPAPRVERIIGDDAALAGRWRRALELAAAMADDERINTGTRYDALRMLGVWTWDEAGKQLVKYLARGTNDELQMGAVSALADLDEPPAARALLSGIAHYNDENRNLALEALLRTPARAKALAAALQDGRVLREQLGPERAARLRKLAAE